MNAKKRLFLARSRCPKLLVLVLKRSAKKVATLSAARAATPSKASAEASEMIRSVPPVVTLSAVRIS